MGRTDNIFRNMESTVFAQIPLFLISFVVRKVFMLVLGEHYLGLNGLFSNILAVLSVVELGFGASITYNLYQSLASADVERLKSLMCLYQKVYTAIGLSIIALGASLTPFLGFFMEELPDDVQHVETVYLLHVLYSGIPYFSAYKESLMFADQKKYIGTVIHSCAQIVCHIVQLILLAVFRNYVLYAACLVVTAVVINIWVSAAASRRYPFLLEKDVRPLSREDTSEIRRNVGAMVCHRFGAAAVNGTDNILIAKFVSLAAVGRYSNYAVILNALNQVLERLYADMMASMGNLSVVEKEDRKLRAFHDQNFFSAWLIGFCAICLRHLYNPFITLWLGEEFLFPQEIVTVIVLNFYLSFMRKPVVYTKEAMGLFWYDRYVPLVEAALNLVLSIILSQPLGTLGILLGTTISMILVPFWIQPVILYRMGLGGNPASYFIRFGVYTAVTVLAGWVTGWLCGLLPGGIIAFVFRALVCFSVPNAVFFLVYWRTEEFQYLYRVGTRIGKKLIKG